MPRLYMCYSYGSPMRIWMVLFLVSALAVLLLTGLVIFDFVKLDACHEQGGSFDPETGLCDLGRAHAEQPYYQQRPPSFYAASGETVVAEVSGTAVVMKKRVKS